MTTQLADLAHHALTAQIDRSAALASRARRARLDRQLQHARSIGFTLDAARKMLDLERDAYLDAARAYARAAVPMLDNLDGEIERAEITAHHAERVTADDVLAWCDHAGVELLPWQRHYIERWLTA